MPGLRKTLRRRKIDRALRRQRAEREQASEDMAAPDPDPVAGDIQPVIDSFDTMLSSMVERIQTDTETWVETSRRIDRLVEAEQANRIRRQYLNSHTIHLDTSYHGRARTYGWTDGYQLNDHNYTVSQMGRQRAVASRSQRIPCRPEAAHKYDPDTEIKVYEDNGVVPSPDTQRLAYTGYPEQYGIIDEIHEDLDF